MSRGCVGTVMQRDGKVSGMSRRDFMRGVGATALSASGLLSSSALASDKNRAAAQACILLWMDGGMSHLDTFDPKPDAPVGIRSEFRTIHTAGPGVQITELFPRMARVMDRVAVLHGISHDEESHAEACHLAITGRTLRGDTVELSIGATVAHAFPHKAISIGEAHFAHGFGQCGRTVHANAAPAPVSIADAYGSHRFGRECLLARQQVEAGAKFITVSLGGWDTHCDNSKALQEWLAPTLDQGMAALIEDLDRRGLLATTLIVCMSEFGRMPKINPLGGRDHWPRAGCALMAGAGIPGGQVIGATDGHGAEAVHSAITPQDVTASILMKLGVASGNGSVNQGTYIQALG